MIFNKRILALLITASTAALALQGCNSGSNNNNPAPPPAAGVDFSVQITKVLRSHPGMDLSQARDQVMADYAANLYGVDGPLTASASTERARAADMSSTALPQDGVTSFGKNAAAQVDLAKGLSATYLTRIAADWTDMMTPWDVDGDGAEDYLISCVEQRIPTVDINGAGKRAPSVQRIDLANGEVKTILRGMNACDGIRTTAWGTVLVTEEAGTNAGPTGQAYEIINPLTTNENIVLDRAAGTIVQSDGVTASTNIVQRTALPRIAWEGLTVLDNGVVIGGDELRPGDWDLAGLGGGNKTPDADGGSIFKFVPTTAHTGGVITDLANSPLVSGTTYAMRVSCVDGNSSKFTINYGQGCELGQASWVPVGATTARLDANNNGATGYYRPEDLHRDPTYVDANNADAVRFCWTNTGNEKGENYGEVMCGIDAAPLTADAATQTVVVNRFIEGDKDFNSIDNLAFQPGTGILYVIEDHDFGDVWACLPDGADRDLKSDGCVKVLSVASDGTQSEPTGFVFSLDGSKAYLSIQHSGLNNPNAVNFNADRYNDMGSCESDLNVDGKDDCLYDDWDTDDVLLIEGFAPLVP